MDLLDAHGQAMAVFDRAVRAVEPSDWDAPTPCTDWSVRDLVHHLVSEQLWVPDLLAGRTIAEVGDRYDGDVLGSDPAGVWASSSSAARAAWLAPGATERTVHLSYGDEAATEYGWQMTTDLAVHGWDLATALGRDAGLPGELAESLLSYVEPQVSAWSGTGMFAGAVPVPEDATAATRLVGLLGREP